MTEPQVLDRRPLLPRGYSSIDRSESLVQGFERVMRDWLRDESIEGDVVANSPTSAEKWAELTVWQPTGAPGITKRSKVRLEVSRVDFHSFPQLVTVTVSTGGWTRSFPGVIPPHERELRGMLASVVLGDEHRPKLVLRRVRQYGFDWWRPSNAGPFDGASLSTALGWQAGIYAASLAFVGLVVMSPPLAVLVAVGAIGVALYLRYVRPPRRQPTLGDLRPTLDPRVLAWEASWQTVIPGLGNLASSVEHQVRRTITTDSRRSLTFEEEQLDYLSADGRERRRVLRAQYGRAQVSLDIRPIASDLFIGWSSYLNQGVWREADIGTGKIDGVVTQLRGLRSSVESPTEYDQFDCKMLTEVVHAIVTREVRAVVEQHKIDVDLDFHYARRLDRRTEPAAEPSRLQGVARKLFRRTG